MASGWILKGGDDYYKEGLLPRGLPSKQLRNLVRISLRKIADCTLATVSTQGLFQEDSFPDISGVLRLLGTLLVATRANSTLHTAY